MASRSDLRRQYLMQNQLDSERLVGGGIAAVRQAAVRRQRRIRLWKLAAACCGVLSAVLLLQGWRLSELHHLARADHGQIYYGFQLKASAAKISFCLYGGLTAALLAMAIGLTMLIRQWNKSRLLSRAQRGMVNVAGE